MGYKERSVQKKFSAEHFQANKAIYRENRKRNRPKYVARNQKFVEEYKEENPCLDCNGKFPACAMDFDHLDPSEKLNTISFLVHKCASLDVIKEEIKKCELVCANCHRVRTYSRIITG